jgi:hypothetical protein
MIRIGFWLVAGAVACLALTFLPTIFNGPADLDFTADILFCEGDRAVMSVNLSEAALTKGNLGTIISGYCMDPVTGQRRSSITPDRVADRLVILLFAAIFGVLLMGIGLFRRKGRQSIWMAAEPTTGPSSKTAAQVRQRDAEDRAARTEADYHRANAPVVAPRVATAATIPDWMAGMPAASLSSSPQPPSQRFDFGEPTSSAPSSDLQIQLNLLQIAYESSLITRSEYDARRDALRGRTPG